MAEGRRYDVVLMDWRMPDLDGLSAAQLIRQLRGDLPPPMVIAIAAYGREVLADARDHSAPPFVDFLTKPVTPKQLADSVLHALHGEQGAPANPPPRRWSTSGCQGVRLLVVEDNALNRPGRRRAEQRGRPGGPRRRRAGGRSAGAGGERARSTRC